MLKALKHCLLLITFVSAVAQQSDEITKPINTAKITDKTVDVNLNSDQDQDSDNNAKLTELCKEFFIDAAQLKLFDYLITSAITIAHELGHATAIKSLFNVHNSVQIHIGTNTPEKIPQLFSLGNMHFYKKFPWKCGLTKSGEISLENNRMAYQKMLRCIARAAGGMSGGTFMYSLLLAVTSYCAYCDNKELYEITLKSLINATSPFS